MAQISWNTEDHKDADVDVFVPIPEGQYPAMIVSSEQKTSTAGFPMIVFKWEIIDEKYKGRQIFDYVLLSHHDASTLQMNKRQMNNIIRGCGKISANFTEELHGIPCLLTLKIKVTKPYIKDGVQHEGNPQNEIKTYTAVLGGSKPVESAATTGTAQPTAAAKKPWEK